MGLGKAQLSFTCLFPQDLPQGQDPRFAVLGRSNVGKSSFLNSLVHPDKLFKTGKEPGVTRGLIGVKVWLGQSEKSILELVDLPGFGFAKNPSAIWADLGEELKTKSVNTGLLWLWLADPQRVPNEEENLLMKWLGREAFVLIFTKSDKIKDREQARVLKEWSVIAKASIEGPFFVSSLKGTGMENIAKLARNFVRNSREALHET